MARNTKEKIIQAFFELALDNPSKSRFSIAEIAQQAGISRQAIYKKHFSNVEDIIQYIRQTIMTPFLPLYESYEEGNGENPFCFFAKHMIPTLYEHRKWMKVLYTTAIDPFWSDYLSTFFTLLGCEARLRLTVHPDSRAFAPHGQAQDRF